MRFTIRWATILMLPLAGCHNGKPSDRPFVSETFEIFGDSELAKTWPESLAIFGSEVEIMAPGVTDKDGIQFVDFLQSLAHTGMSADDNPKNDIQHPSGDAKTDIEAGQNGTYRDLTTTNIRSLSQMPADETSSMPPYGPPALDQDQPKQAKINADQPASTSQSNGEADISRKPVTTALTIRQAVSDAIMRDPDIAIEDSRFRQAMHEIDIAAGALLPRLDVQASTGPRYGDGRDIDETTTLSRDGSVLVRQKIYDGKSTLHLVSSRRFQREAASFSVRVTQESITLEVALAYLGLLEAKDLLELAIANRGQHERIMVLVSASVQQGFSAQADLSRVEARLADARSLVFDQMSARDQASQRLEKLIGREPGTQMVPELRSDFLPSTFDQALDDMVSGNPRLAQLRAETTAAERELKAQIGKFVPNIDMLIQGSMNKDTSGNTGIGGEVKGLLVMNYNIYAGGADKARERTLRERVRETDLQYRKELRDRRQSLSDQFTALDASRQKRGNLDDGVTASESVSKLYLEQFRAGRRSVFELLDGQVDLYTARRDRVQNLFEALKRSYQILSDLGQLRMTIELQ